MRALALAYAALAVLAACSSQPETSAPPPPPFKQACITPTPWTTQQQADLANALAPIPQTSPIWTLELDWQRMRDEADACLKAQK